jgi:hypothetical protein
MYDVTRDRDFPFHSFRIQIVGEGSASLQLQSDIWGGDYLRSNEVLRWEYDTIEQFKFSRVKYTVIYSTYATAISPYLNMNNSTIVSYRQTGHRG